MKSKFEEATNDLARGLQFEALFHACSVLSHTIEADVPIQDWMLFEVDEEGNPLKPMDGMHEILLGLYSTGREMRPKKIKRVAW